MRIFTVLGIIFYATILILIGAGLILAAVLSSVEQSLVTANDLVSLLAYFQDTFSARLILGLSGILLILISFSFAQLILGRFQSEKTIAFTTASGEVTVTLTAIEDLIKKLAGLLPEIKELRPDVIASKKGIIVDLRVVLRTEASIPELSARLQDIVRGKIQEVLGLEEQIIIKIHFVKIITSEDKDKKHHYKEPPKDDPIVPYSGYRRV